VTLRWASESGYFLNVTSQKLESAEDRLRRALSELSSVRLAFLFGSRALGHPREESDFDVAILVDEGMAEMERGEAIRHLAARLGREVSSSLLDIVLLNDAPALLRHRVLRDGILLFQRSPEERVRFVTKTIRDYQDGVIRRERFTKSRIEKLKVRTDDGGSGNLLEKARGVARLLRKAERVS
jgi:predicted nucleotidyltransferase